jgi:hypothetical protein
MTDTVGYGVGNFQQPMSLLSHAPATETRRSSAALTLDPNELTLQPQRSESTGRTTPGGLPLARPTASSHASCAICAASFPRPASK